MRDFCANCGQHFLRTHWGRGRRPTRCPACRKQDTQISVLRKHVVQARKKILQLEARIRELKAK